eukprot:g4076.t1
MVGVPTGGALLFTQHLLRTEARDRYHASFTSEVREHFCAAVTPEQKARIQSDKHLLQYATSKWSDDAFHLSLYENFFFSDRAIDNESQDGLSFFWRFVTRKQRPHHGPGVLFNDTHWLQLQKWNRWSKPPNGGMGWWGCKPTVRNLTMELGEEEDREDHVAEEPGSTSAARGGRSTNILSYSNEQASNCVVNAVREFPFAFGHFMSDLLPMLLWTLEQLARIRVTVAFPGAATEIKTPHEHEPALKRLVRENLGLFLQHRRKKQQLQRTRSGNSKQNDPIEFPLLDLCNTFVVPGNGFSRKVYEVLRQRLRADVWSSHHRHFSRTSTRTTGSAKANSDARLNPDRDSSSSAAHLTDIRATIVAANVKFVYWDGPMESFYARHWIVPAAPYCHANAQSYNPELLYPHTARLMREYFFLPQQDPGTNKEETDIVHVAPGGTDELGVAGPVSYAIPLPTSSATGIVEEQLQARPAPPPPPLHVLLIRREGSHDSMMRKEYAWHFPYRYLVRSWVQHRQFVQLASVYNHYLLPLLLEGGDHDTMRTSCGSLAKNIFAQIAFVHVTAVEEADIEQLCDAVFEKMAAEAVVKSRKKVRDEQEGDMVIFRGIDLVVQNFTNVGFTDTIQRFANADVAIYPFGSASANAAFLGRSSACAAAAAAKTGSRCSHRPLCIEFVGNEFLMPSRGKVESLALGLDYRALVNNETYTHNPIFLHPVKVFRALLDRLVVGNQ